MSIISFLILVLYEWVSRIKLVLSNSCIAIRMDPKIYWPKNSQNFYVFKIISCWFINKTLVGFIFFLWNHISLYKIKYGSVCGQSRPIYFLR